MIVEDILRSAASEVATAVEAPVTDPALIARRARRSHCSEVASWLAPLRQALRRRAPGAAGT
jgi:hypothetical protein